MMKSLGHTVYLYAGWENEADCDELITCMTRPELEGFLGIPNFGPVDILKAPFDWTLPHWSVFNYRAIEATRERIQPGDFICIMGGLAHKQITDSFPNNIACEFGIGYPGSFLPHRVFETYAWMHMNYGHEQALPAAQGKNYDRIIPSYFEEEDFPFSAEKDDYFLFTGRITKLKGWEVAVEAASRLDTKLILAGQSTDGPPPTGKNVEYVGVVGPERRGELMSRARAQFTPTLYVEPFGSVAPEAMMCGTPVITTDWGAFPELVEQGVDGYRCRLLRDFVEAGRNVDDLDYGLIRNRGVQRWGMRNVRWQYQHYFDDLATLSGEGWYTMPDAAMGALAQGKK